MWFNTFERDLRISNKQKFGFLEHKNTYRFVWKGIHFTETCILKTPYRLYENTTLCCIKCISGKKNTYNILTIQHTMGKKQLSITKFLKRTLKYIAWIQYTHCGKERSTYIYSSYVLIRKKETFPTENQANFTLKHIKYNSLK